ncbi:MAG: FtsX-like permease family protein [Crocinitomicaceae bacterium]|nr:FtsX-like permease family protein [Crocinitomicaceae bacterium]
MGIAVTTAALVILIAAFNGIESMVEQLYSEYDSNITIRSSKGKSFDENSLDIKKIKSNPEVSNTSKALEEIVVIKNEQKWANARMIGVEPDFLKIAKVSDHLVDGYPTLMENEAPMALIGATLLDKLDGYIPKMEGEYERVDVYFPKREAKVSNFSNPFKNLIIPISGRVNYNREVNQEAFIIPIELAKEMLDYEQNITALFVNLKDKSKSEKVKRILQEQLGTDWVVKTHLEKNALIYQTSKSEKLIVIGILVFIFIMAAFNLVASLTMLYIEKKDNIKTMQSFGANQNFVFRIFFYEGLLISAKGIISGLAIGYLICATQIFGELVKMPNSGGEAFPISINWTDGALVLVLVSSLSILASYIPVKFLTRKQG